MGTHGNLVHKLTRGDLGLMVILYVTMDSVHKSDIAIQLVLKVVKDQLNAPSA